MRIEGTASTLHQTGLAAAGRPDEAPDDLATATVVSDPPDPAEELGAGDPVDGDGDPVDGDGASDGDGAAIAASRPRGLAGVRADLGRLGAAIAQRFRLPDSNDPAPQPGRMLGVCAWATALGFVGVGVALRALVGLLGGDVPGWFEPTITTTGLLGICLTATAFAAVHRPRLPWALLGAATVMLGITLSVSFAIL